MDAIKIQSLFDLADRVFPLEATTAGVHLHDCLTGTVNADVLQEKRAEFATFAEDCASIHFPSHSPLRQAELILAMRRAAECIIRIDERPWDYDPLFWLIPFSKALFYMHRRDYAPYQERACSIVRRLECYPSMLAEAMECLRPCPPLCIRNAKFTASGVGHFITSIIEDISVHIPSWKEKLMHLRSTVLHSLTAFSAFLDGLSCDSVLPPSPGRSLLLDTLAAHEPEELFEYGNECLSAAEKRLASFSEGRWKDSNWQRNIARTRKNHPSPERMFPAYHDMLAKAGDFSMKWTGIPCTACSIRVIETPIFMRLLYPAASFSAAGEMEKEQDTFCCITPLHTQCSREELETQLEEHCFGRIELAAIHEGFPGHHLQLTMAALNASRAFRRTRIPLASEGWALFCEDAAADSGFFSDDGMLAYLEAGLWRAARFVIETGMNYGFITADEASRIITGRLGAPENYSSYEIMRILSSHGESYSYMMGKLHIDRLYAQLSRKNPQSRKSDLARLILRAGPIPPSVLAFCEGLAGGEEMERARLMLCSAMGL